MNKKKVFEILFLLTLAILVSAGSYSFLGQYSPVLIKKFFSSEKDRENQNSNYGEKFQRTEVPEISSSKKKLTRAEYKMYVGELTDLIYRGNPTDALRKMKEDFMAGYIASDCHNLTHEIGHVAFERYKDPLQALEYKEQVCGYGYIHGVVESYVALSQNPLETIGATCQNYPEGRNKMECYHAMGHALMIYSGNDLPFALEGCDGYLNDLARESCSVGVFMENFSADEDHPSQFVDKDEPLAPCQDQKAIYKPSCYKMASLFYLTLHNNDFSHILDWCNGAEPDFHGFCVRGAALQFIQYLYAPKVIEQFCFSGSAKSVPSCIREMVRIRLLGSERLEVEKVCKELSSSTAQEICQKAVWSESKF